MRASDAEAGLPLPDGRRLAADEAAGRLQLWLSSEPIASFARSSDGPRTVLASSRPPDSPLALWAASYWLFAREAACEEIAWELPQASPAALETGLLMPESGGWRTRREQFWQLPWPWLIESGAAEPEAGTSLPPKPSGELYRRFDSRLGQWISLRTLDLALDLERFNRWQNSPRVLQFWQEGGTLEQHHDYLSRLATDPHTFPVIGCFDDEPFAYFEVYWAKADRIAPFYAVSEHDRGIHMLVGEEHHRGPHKVASWLSALVHYAFLADSRTQTLVSEPRHDNARMIRYMEQVGFDRVKDFDFPHKRAALMMLTRDYFFNNSTLM